MGRKKNGFKRLHQMGGDFDFIRNCRWSNFELLLDACVATTGSPLAGSSHVHGPFRRMDKTSISVSRIRLSLPDIELYRKDIRVKSD